MDVLCLMGLFPNGYEDEIVKNSLFGTQNAANKLQWGIVKGLDAQPGVTVRICNSLYIGSYPRRYKKLLIPTFPFQHREGSKDMNVGFLNLTGIKYISRYWSCRAFINKWEQENTNQEKTLIVYALTMPFTNLAGYVRRKYPDIKVCVVVPDLPEYMNTSAMGKNGIYSKAKRLSIKWIKRSLRHIDHYVLLTDQMKEWFERPIKYTVVEGTAQASDDGMSETREKTILYAGGIKREYGVIDLAEAFARIDAPEWQLVIYGDGSDLGELRELAQNDKRIKLMGSVPNKTVVAHQRKASLLVNPRKNQEFTKYSFPSKILEYMSSGTPMLAYKLAGVPDEYDSYYYQIPTKENGMEDALRSAMLLSDNERNTMGASARAFVRDGKSPEIQCKKIIALLNQDA